MNKFTKIVFTLIATFFITTLQSQNVKVICVNRTGFNLDSLIIGDVLLGQLQNDSSSNTVTFEEIHLDSGAMPLIFIKANINEQPITQYKMPFFCGTSIERKTEGNYVFYIHYNKTMYAESLHVLLQDKIK